MTARLPLLTLFRLWAALLVAVIGIQAAAPPAAAAELAHGSAFSASTYEVALVVKRGERVQREEVAPQPFAPVIDLTRPFAAEASAKTDSPMPRPSSTGPPFPSSIQAWKPAPRAPPRT